MRLSEAIEDLCLATMADGRSQQTVKDYRQKLGYLLTYLGDVDVTLVTANDLRRYVVHMRDRDTLYVGHAFRPVRAGGLATATLATRIRAMKRLFNFLAVEGVIDPNPVKKIKVPKLQRGREPKAISEADFLRILDEAASDARDNSIVLFLADTGCRRGGLVGLRISDLELDRGRAWVTEKGNKRRAVFLSGPTVRALTAWLAVRPAVANESVWLSHTTNEPLTGDGVSQLLSRLGKKSGCTGPHGAHSFRHALARHWLLLGGPDSTLADVMGHSDVGVTRNFYAIFKQDELQQMHARFSYVAKLDGSTDHG